jgi:hypothetical protein
MFRHDRFREDLMREQAEEIFAMEGRIQEIDTVFVAAQRHVQAARCECGAPIVYGSHFCANCGRPTGEAVVTCTKCGHPLPADARFCGNCGTVAPPAEQQESSVVPPAEAPSAAESRPAASPSEPPPRDSWER